MAPEYLSESFQNRQRNVHSYALEIMTLFVSHHLDETSEKELLE